MTYQLNPYLSFDGDARAAMEFYKDVFGGTLTLNTFSEFGADQDNPQVSDRIMHASLQAPNGLTLMASDAMPGEAFEPGNAYAVSLSGDADSLDELRECWRRLSDGGTVTMPLEKQVWGDEFGMCTDRFGTPWMIDIGLPESS